MEERKMILKMIEDGKITADEGLALLQELDRQSKTESGHRTSEPVTEGKEHKEHKDHKDHKGYKDHKDHKGYKDHKESKEQILKFKDDIQKFTDKLLTGTNRWVSKMDKVGKVFQKISGDDFDIDNELFSGNGVRVTELYEVAPHRILHFTSNGSVKCKTWEKEFIQIHVNAIDSKANTEWQAKEKLKQLIKQEENEGKYSFIVSEDNGMRVAVEVLVPKQKYESVAIFTSNGKVQLSELESEQVKIQTSNGSIRMEEIDGQQLEATTSNGAIRLKDVDLEVVSLQTSNGKIEASGQMAALISETSNGSIRIEQETMEGSKIKARTTNGSVRIGFPDHVSGVYGQIKSSFFNQLKCSLSNANIVEERDRVVIEQGEEKKHYVDVETSQGSIHLYEKGQED